MAVQGNYVSQAQAQALVPSVAATLLVTLFFGIFGLIPAVSHSNRARMLGAPTNKYWITFAAVMGSSFVFWMIVLSSSGMH